MIRPGRRRRAGPPELDWHLRLAASRRRRLRTRRGAWTGLAGAFVGAIWVLAGGPPWSTAVLAALGTVAGAAVPVRDSERWARRWIGERHGLGYDTALEAEGRPDPHGLWAASRDRARLGLRGATPPVAERWWLPPAIAAVLLITASPWLATVPRPAAPASDRAATDAARADRDAGGTVPGTEGEGAGSSGPAGAVPPPERPDAVADGAAPPPDTRDAPAARDEDEADGPATDGDGDATATGGAAVDRFLRDLEPTPDEATNPFDPAGRRVDEEGSLEARDGGRAAPEDVPPRSGAAGSETGRATDESGAGSPSEGGSPDGTGPRSEGGATSDSEGDETGDEAGSNGGGDQADGGEEARDRAADGDGAGATPDATTDAARGDPGGDAGTPEGQRDDGADAAARDGRDEADAGGLDPGEGEAGEAGAAGSDGRDGDAAGAAGGEAGGAEPSADGEAQPFLGGPDGAAERLSGRPGEGPAPSVGSVRGGGQAPASVPEGAPVDPSYERAAERAADEAGLPGVYREIIRRYFR